MRSETQPKEKIAIVSTGYALNQKNLDEIIEKLQKAFPQFEFIAPPDLLSIECQNNNSGITMPANTAEMRALHLINAIKNPEITAIWSMTGSEGASEVIDHIQKYDEKFGLPRQNPKLFIGMSDVTILHIYLGQQGLVKPVHASLLTTLFVPTLKQKFKKVADSEIKLIEEIILHGNQMSSLSLSTHLHPLNQAAKNAKQLDGPLVGGCTELIVCTKGTEYEARMDGAILVLEGLDHVWVEKGGIHLINTLLDAGMLKNVSAIIFGGIESFKGSNLTDKTLAAKESKEIREKFFKTYQNEIQKFAQTIEIPVYDNFQFGHALDMINTPIPLYTRATISLTSKEEGRLICNPSLTEVPPPHPDKSVKLLARGTLFSKGLRKTDVTAPIHLIPLLNCQPSSLITAPMIGGNDIVAFDKDVGINNALITEGRIVFLGFDSETDPKVDLQAKIPMYLHSLLVHLKQAGMFNSIHALIFGPPPLYSNDKNKQKIFESSVLKIIQEYFKKYSINAPILLMENATSFPKKFQVDNVTISIGNTTKDSWLLPSSYLNNSFTPKKKKKEEPSLQHTLNASINLQGIGFHTGLPSRVTLSSALPDTGIVFQRTDIECVSQELGCPLRWELNAKGKRTGNFVDDNGKIINSKVSAIFNNVTSTTLSTKISNSDKVSVNTIEHFMSALMVAGIDNAIILINGPELPIMDGSCSYIYNAIKMAGKISQQIERNVVIVTAPVKYYDKDRDATFSIQPSDDFEVAVTISFDNPIIGKNKFIVNTKNADQVMDARTFTFEEGLHDPNRLFARSVSPDASKRGAIIVGKDKVIVHKHNKIHSGNLRSDKEFVKHKTLDALGDIATGGSMILGKFELNRSGHEVNNKGMRALYASPQNYLIMRWSQAMDYVKKRRVKPIPAKKIISKL